MAVKDRPLPPPGDERREELKKRTDDLEQEGEQLAGKLERETINPNAFEKIREIQYAISKGAVEVSNRQEGYRYTWVGTHLQGQQIWQKKALGWETVHGDMPEAKEYRTEDSSRRIGDTILMRIPETRAREIDAYEAYQRERKLISVESELIALGEKYRDRGLIVHHGDDEITRTAALRSAGGQAAAKAAFHDEATRTVAASKVDDMLRQGNVPGL